MLNHSRGSPNIFKQREGRRWDKLFNPQDSFLLETVWEFYASYRTRWNQQAQQIGTPTVKSMLVKGDEVATSLKDLFSFWLRNIPMIEVDPTYQKPQIHKHYSWIDKNITKGHQGQTLEAKFTDKVSFRRQGFSLTL